MGQVEGRGGGVAPAACGDSPIEYFWNNVGWLKGACSLPLGWGADRLRKVAMPGFTKSQFQEAAALVYAQMLPTPQHLWPLLSEATGAQVWVKHENHTPTGAFKIRGGIAFIDWLQRTHPDCKGVITATRGNHGQS